MNSKTGNQILLATTLTQFHWPTTPKGLFSTSFRPQKSYDFFRPAVFQNIAPIKMVPVLNVSSQSFSPFLDKNGKIMLQVTILQQIPSITAQFFRNLPGFNLFFPRRRLIWETPPKVSILGAYNTLVGIIVETLHQVFECKPSYLYLHHMETIIQLHTTTSRCIIIQQIFGKTIPKFWESKIPRSSASIKSVFCYHSRPGGWCLPKVSTAEFLGRFQKPVPERRDTYTPHTPNPSARQIGREAWQSRAHPRLCWAFPIVVWCFFCVFRSPTTRCWTNLRNFFEHVSGFTGCIHNQFRVKGVDQHRIVMINLKKNVTKQIESLSFDPPPDVPPPPRN